MLSHQLKVSDSGTRESVTVALPAPEEKERKSVSPETGREGCAERFYGCFKAHEGGRAGDTQTSGQHA